MAALPRVCSLLVRERNGAAWSSLEAALRQHRRGWIYTHPILAREKFHITEVPVTRSKTIAERSNLACTALSSYLQVSD